MFECLNDVAMRLQYYTDSILRIDFKVLLELAELLYAVAFGLLFSGIRDTCTPDCPLLPSRFSR